MTALPAAGAAQAIATNSDQTTYTDDPSEFAHVLTECGQGQTAEADKGKATRDKEEESKIQQENQVNGSICSGQAQYGLALACPLELFAMPDSGAAQTVAPADADASAVGALKTAPDTTANARPQAGLYALPGQEADGLTQKADTGEAAMQTASKSAEIIAEQNQPGDTNINRTAISNERDFGGARVFADALSEQFSVQGNDEDAAFIRMAAVNDNSAEDAGYQGYSETAPESVEYALVQEEADGNSLFHTQNRQIFQDSVKIPQQQTDNDNVETNFTVGAATAQNTAELAFEAMPPQAGTIEQSVFEQVFDKVSEIEVGANNQVTFALKPDSLGSIRIIVEGSGLEMSVTIETDNQKVSQALAGSLGQLASSLGVQDARQDQIRVVFTQPQELVQEGPVSSDSSSGGQRHNVSAQEFLETSRAEDENEPIPMQVLMRTRGFNQYA